MTAPTPPATGLRPRPLALRRKGGGDDDAQAGNPPARRAPLVGLIVLPWALYAYSTVTGLNSFSGGVSPNGGGAPALPLPGGVPIVLPVGPEQARPAGRARVRGVVPRKREDSRDKADSYDKVMIRTHYPAWNREVGGDTRLMDRAILLVRNPLDALPGHASLYYEKKAGLRVDGETPATEEYWLEWRESHFDDELAKWSDQVSHWASREPREKRLVLSYEHL
eukprot:CAMPEP_0113575598 /NCGR_PEP_ID=MMETSP0015_2-20120614/27790_1 /TAXON_ID=2838 /ORGANISM="Odontella" /LENGTH=222 /DNA_ID=CAMNT_0000478861 /DNA_START=117 /DNA_END=780 /DNA_ORIENTATION=+ /assembly_acc=CAM_ASM_000160